MILSSSGCLTFFFVVVSVISTLVQAVPRPGLWDVHIDNGPAPPPDEGPPLSAHALRDKSFLPAQIGGIVGAYAVLAVFWVLLLFIVGRRLRRKAQGTIRPRKSETKSKGRIGNGYELSDLKNVDTPVTVTTMATTAQLPSPKGSANMTWTSPVGHHKSPSAQESVVTFDESVIEDDRAKAQTEMERLYAAVMEHDAKNQAKVVYDAKRNTDSIPPTPRSPTKSPGLPKSPKSPGHHSFTPREPRTPRSPHSPGQYPEFNHLRSPGLPGPGYMGPMSPMGPTMPLSPVSPGPMSPMGPTIPEPPGSPRRHSSHKLSKANPLSLFSHTRETSGDSKNVPQDSKTSLGTRLRQSIRGLPISPPMGSPEFGSSLNQRMEDEEPLSPRMYNPGPPPVPPMEKQVPYSQRTVALQQPPQPPSATPSRAPAPSPLPLQSGKSATSSKSTLPFRSPTFQQQYTVPQSAPPTKTTIIEKADTRMLREAQTGVPQTPYSPYTPFSATTPITPSFLVGKRERKEYRKNLRVLNEEEDMVKDHDDIWGV